MVEKNKSGKQYYRLPDLQNHAAITDTKTPKSVSAVTHTNASKTDPLGMYTGFPEDPEDIPVQDVDDL